MILIQFSHVAKEKGINKMFMKDLKKEQVIGWVENLLQVLQQYDDAYQNQATIAWLENPTAKLEKQPASLAKYFQSLFTGEEPSIMQAIFSFKVDLKKCIEKVKKIDSKSVEKTTNQYFYYLLLGPLYCPKKKYWLTKELLIILQKAKKELPKLKDTKTTAPNSLTTLSSSFNNFPSIPKKLHFLWVGKDIPLKYLLNIAKFYLHAWQSGFEINLWTDRQGSFYQSLYKGIRGIEFFPKGEKQKYEQMHLVKRISKSRSLHTDILPQAVGFLKAIKIRDVEELSGKEIKSYFKTKGQWQKLDLYMSRSKVGSKNLAEFCDFARTLILFKEGGAFIDADDESKETKKIVEKNSINEEQIKKGQKHYTFYFPDLKYGFGCGHTGSKKNEDALNDVIIGMSGHPIFDMLIDEMILAHDELDKSLLDRKIIKNENGTMDVYYRTIDDIKRSFKTGKDVWFFGGVAPRFEKKGEPYRIGLTIYSSGPAVFGRVMRKFAEQYNIEEEDLYIPHEFYEQVLTKSDCNWGSPPDVMSFEESDKISGTNFSQ